MSRAIIAAALRALKGPRVPIAEDAFPSAPGLYALYGAASTWKQLGLESPDDRPLYVGKSERSLLSRDFKMHFDTGQTGWSTLRRTLGALRNLTPVWRDPVKREKPTHYALRADDDAALTSWMTSQLRAAVWEKPATCDDLAAVERAVIQALHPPLNVKDNDSPWRGKVVAARKLMARRLQSASPPSPPTPLPRFNADGVDDESFEPFCLQDHRDESGSICLMFNEWDWLHDLAGGDSVEGIFLNGYGVETLVQTALSAAGIDPDGDGIEFDSENDACVVYFASVDAAVAAATAARAVLRSPMSLRATAARTRARDFDD
jgi:hypothetical protein